MTTRNITSEQSVSQILINSRTQKERLFDILTNVINIRRQLDGEFPESDSEEKSTHNPGLVGAILNIQGEQDDFIDRINAHMDVIHTKLGTFYHPNCEDESKDNC
ncbi:hypothetical protein Phi10_145 [Salmonella phage vB_SentM_Phi_10]|uniref:Uncharacterized protein n=4 Tax=Kuttervirus TaxID=2169536 RepID=A0A1X9I8V8_9CAUD|nr:hypothetical protein DET7_15 [Salmonella phage Det7]YP_009879561.1 hypothetical protein HYP54_gp148 [Escherichia phage FEC14]YP_009888752.1 hypothetical protein HYQ36_gp029 [Salmonella phage moki]ANT44474.1 hypothetical protein vB_SenM-2_015 [Salmonella phage vB_SenM-2]QFR58791.1 hypothetical protein Phi10_145 [Salmonella phage vB_SentM_Phi_10]WPJ70565.1 hypothetical protein orfRA148_00184c [Salmonella phage RA148]AJQ20834.1 hypothetical protein DET7_15 [Salmonella phage Det7]ATW66785.1 h